MLKYLMLLTE